MSDESLQWQLALDQPESAGPRTLRRSGIFVGAILLVAAFVLAVGRIPLEPFPQFANYHAVFVLVVDAITAFLLFGQFVFRRMLSYAILASAFLFSALVSLPFLLSFPGALKADVPFMGGSQSSIWVWHLWHILFPVIVILALIVHERAASGGVPVQRIRRVIALSVAVTVGLVVLVAIVVIAFHDHLPPLITEERIPLTAAFYVVGAAAGATTAVALVLSLRLARRRAVLFIWLAVVLTAYLADVSASLAAHARYSLAWYLGRLESMFAVSVLLVVFLNELNLLYRRLGLASVNLLGANRRLSALIEEKDALVVQLQHSEREVRRLAYYDPVTELPNRRLLLELTEHALAQAARYHREMAVLFMDLDRFKSINDTLGHHVGDLLLHEVAVRLKHCVRSGDTVSRIGGDEFVILLPEIERVADAAAVADKVIAMFREPFDVAGHTIIVTTSLGVATPVPGSTDCPELLKRADAAMYAAKNAGRNRYCIAEEA